MDSIACALADNVCGTLQVEKFEDFNVGKSIFRATDTILRQDAHTLIERMNVGVIGFGKIGQSIAFHLQRNYVTSLRVYDIDPVARVHAASLASDVTSKDRLLRQSDLIFCAAGNKPLSGSDFEMLRDNVFIASCTSADDEFDLSSLTEQATQNTQNIKVMKSLTNKNVNMMAGGNAINFVYGGVNGAYIYGVQAGLIAGCTALMSNQGRRVGQISLLPINSQRAIADTWLKFFLIADRA